MEDRQTQIKNEVFILAVMNNWKKVPWGMKDSLHADVFHSKY